MVFSFIGLSVHLSSQLRCNSCKLGIGKDSSCPNSFLSNKNWRMCSALIEHILQFLYTIVIANLCLSVLLSKTLLLTPCAHLLFCLQSLCSSVLYKSLTPVRRPPLCRRGAGGEAMPRKRENQINTLVLKDINFTINIIDCLITERLRP